MPVNLSVKNVPDALAQRLRERAHRNRRSLQRELLTILEGVASERGAAPSGDGPAAGALTVTQVSERAAALQARALHAPDLIDYELISVALKKIRRERLPQAAVTSALALIDGMAVERHRLDMSSVLRLADRYALTAYDAAYLSLAELLGAPLATFDEQLAAAAREHLAEPPLHGEGDAA